QRQELLVRQRLDRHRVVRPPALRQRLELHGQRDERFPGPGGRVQDHVLVLEQLQDGLLLVGVRFRSGPGEEVEEGVQDVIRGGILRKIGGGKGWHGEALGRPSSDGPFLGWCAGHRRLWWPSREGKLWRSTEKNWHWRVRRRLTASRRRTSASGTCAVFPP